MARTKARGLLVGRREILKWGGVAFGSSALSACGVGAGATDSADLTAIDFALLRQQLGGKLLAPTDAGYDNARLVFNPLFDDRRPQAVVRCATPDDVQACVAFARKNPALRLAARSGGHSYAGYSSPDKGLVVDLRAMKSVVVNPDGTTVVGAGARLFDVYSAVAAAGRCLPAGSCPSVGVSGLTLGGGIGVMARLHGLTCDALVAADIVLSDGTRKTVSAENDPDLFWALRGGGGGNFGIVTSFTFAAPKAPSSMFVWKLRFPTGATAHVLDAWQKWIAELPRETWSNCVVSAGDPATCRVGGSFVGSQKTLDGLLDDLVRRVGSQPTTRTTTEKSYIDAMRFFGGCSQLTTQQCHVNTEGGTLAREGFVASSRMLEAPMSDPSRVTELMTHFTGMDLLFDSLGGAVADIAPDATAFPHRNALASVQVYKGTTAQGRDATAKEVGEVQSALASIVGKGTYANYIDPNMENWAEAAYGGNLARLQDVSRKFDADGFFTFAQSLAPRG
jgi:FAD/FMN-containing dehydrogenase